MNRNISLLAFALGLAAVAWVAFGYLGGHGIALAVSCLIAAVYLAGATEMRRFHRNTAGLADALQRIPDDLAHLGEWLQQVPAALQNTVRLRIEGERVALPGPSMTPYLVGLLVLLGMLGTFLGMVVTLNGAVLALESTTDLQTIRAALAAPVKGLGVAFGTSVAGVATSAMLGLISALCRRDRIQVGQLLDSKIAGVLRDFSLAHQRQETFKVLQSQAQALPDLVARVEATMERIAEQNRQLGEHLLAGQQGFYQEAKGVYGELARSVDQSLKDSLRDSAKLAAETVEPVVAATMSGIARETASLHDKLFGTAQSQFDALGGRFSATLESIGETWEQALQRHEQATDSQHRQQQTALQAYAETFEQRAGGLLASVDKAHAELHNAAERRSAEQLQAARDGQEQLASAVASRLDAVAGRLDQAVTQAAETWQGALAEHRQASHALVAAVGDSQAAIKAELLAAHAEFAGTAEARQAALAEQVAERLDGIAEHLDQAVNSVAGNWSTALARHEQASERLTAALDRTQSALADSFAQRSAALLAEMQAIQGNWQREWSAGEQARQATFADALAATASRLESQWQAADEAAQAQQAQYTRTLAETARELVAATQQQTGTTIAEVTRLMQTAAEAPKAAAEVIGQLRHELSASMARDNSLLEERSRIMETLGTLLEAINHASTEQRAAIDALVGASAELLDRVGSRFAERVDSETGKLVEIGASLSGGALEVASLSEAFGVAVQLFSTSNDKMAGALQRIEGALAKSLSRSDEQLAYYVAQAREIIDLSIMSQQRIVDDLRRAAGSEA